MKPAPFDYYAPRSLDEALTLAAQHGYGAKLLAGGQSLIPAMNFRLAQPGVIIDLNKVAGLDTLAASNGELAIGALVRHSRVEHDPMVAAVAPLLAEVGHHIAHPQIRHRGTFGGSMAHADPAAHWPVAVLALGARFRVRSRASERWVDGPDFFTGLYSTVLGPDEILVEVAVKGTPPGTGWSYRQVARQHGAFPLCGVAAVISVDAAGKCSALNLVFLGAGDRPMIAQRGVKPLLGQAPTAEAIRAAAETAARFDVDPSNDIHASAAYRKHLLRVLAEKALAEAAGRAGGARSGQ